MEVTGLIKRISDTQKVSERFQKREVVVTTEEQYPQHLSIEFIQDKTSLLDSYREGDRVNIGINLRGREWTSPQGEVKYFNTIQGWRIEKQGSGMEQSAGSTPDFNAGGSPTGSSTPPPMPPMNDDDDDLPF
jgi:single-stranded DNA-binding protein